MTEHEKRRRAAMIAVAYYVEEETQRLSHKAFVNHWKEAGKEVSMGNRIMVQRRGRTLRS